MGTIYEIICWTTGLRYVGKTIQSLERRLIEHKSRFKKGADYNPSVYSVLEHNNYQIYELEKVEDESMLTEREFYHIQHTDCVNHYVGKWLDEDFKKEYMKEYLKEYYQVNKETASEKGKERYEANKEVILEKCKEYREANKEAISERGKEKYTCECGSILRKNNKKRHERESKKHLDWLATQT